MLIHGMDSMQEYGDFVEKVRNITAYRNLIFIPIAEEDKKTFGHMLNRAVEQCGAEYIVVMDIACIPLDAGWIDEMLMYAQRKDVAAVAPKILFKNNTIAYAGAALDKDREDKIRYLCQGMPDTEDRKSVV